MGIGDLTHCPPSVFANISMAGAGAHVLSAVLAARVRGGACVVVARWFGGRNLGPARFGHFADRAAALLHGAGVARGGGPCETLPPNALHQREH